MSTEKKRQQFSKDLDKLISGDYVIVPKRCSNTMAQACANYMKEYFQENEGYNPWEMWRVMWEQALTENNGSKE